MLVYLLNILFIIIWALIFSIGKKNKLKKTLFVVICFIQLFLISGFRDEVGFDYNMYFTGFFSMAVDGFAEMSYYDWEIGYILLNKIIGVFITARSSDIILITSALSLIGPAYLIIRYSKNPFLSVFLYVNLFLFYLDMNFIRQAIAMSILCFAYGFLKEGKLWRYLLIVLIASTFHSTVLYMIPVYFVSRLKINSRTLLIYLFGLFYYFMLSDDLLNFILLIYHGEYSGTEFITQGLNPILVIFPVLLSVGAAVLSYFVKNRTKEFDVLVHMTLMMAFWQMAMTKHMIFERFSYYTMLFVIIAVPEFICALNSQFKSSVKKRFLISMGESKNPRAVSKAIRLRTNIASMSVTAAVLVSAFVYNMFCGLILPSSGAHGVLPYQTRLDIDIPNIDSFFKDNI